MNTATPEIDLKSMSTEALKAMHAEKVAKILAVGPLSDARNKSDAIDAETVKALYAEINSREKAAKD